MTEPLSNLLKNKRFNKTAKPYPFAGLVKRLNKKQTRLYIDNEYLERGYAALFPSNTALVYLALARYANYQTQQCYPSITEIMRSTGLKNRNTVVKAIKILEAYRIIGVSHGKGKRSNNYLLLDTSQWRTPNSINFDTITRKVAVSPTKPLQYQKHSPSGIKTDTQNNISKSYKEIKENNFNTNSCKSLLKKHYKEIDIDLAIKELQGEANPVTTPAVKALLGKWAAAGKITRLEPMNW
jgi:DNA-binding transcriptional regulator GbsR (MarR family)